MSGKMLYKSAFAFLAVMLFSVQPLLAGPFDFKDRVRGSGDLAEEERQLDKFTRIESNGSFDIDIIVGKQQRVLVEFDDNLLEFVETEVEDGTLIISSSKNVSFSSRRGCVITIAVSELEGLSLSGSGDIDIDNLEADKFEYDISGSGDFRANGTVNSLYIEISGSGDIDAEELIAKDAKVRISGSGDASIYVTGNLDAKVYGSGDIVYYGSPEKVRAKVHGSGSIEHH